MGSVGLMIHVACRQRKHTSDERRLHALLVWIFKVVAMM
jgi:hypothetical protein